MSTILNEYARVTKRRPCPICGKPDWCLVARDGTNAICTRTESNEPRGEAGFLHKLEEDYRQTVIRRPLLKPPPQANGGTRMDWDKAALLMGLACTDQMAEHVAASLGLSHRSIDRLSIGWCENAAAWSFPMFDANVNVIGIRLRKPDGFKFAVKGGSNGLFIPSDLTGEGPLLIEEGPTSTAALLDFGFDAIGRPSCSACVDMTTEYVARSPHREWVIVQNNDTAKKRPDGSVFYPGQDGARKLAASLVLTGKPGKIIAPMGVKDSRDWKQAGATRGTVLGAISNGRYIARSAA